MVIQYLPSKQNDQIMISDLITSKYTLTSILVLIYSYLKIFSKVNDFSPLTINF